MPIWSLLADSQATLKCCRSILSKSGNAWCWEWQCISLQLKLSLLHRVPRYIRCSWKLIIFIRTSIGGMPKMAIKVNTVKRMCRISYQRRLVEGDSMSGSGKRHWICRTARSAVDTGTSPLCLVLVPVLCHLSAPSAVHTFPDVWRAEPQCPVLCRVDPHCL